MKDVQNQADARGIDIQNVGIKGFHMPLLIRTRQGGFQQVMANVSLSVSLPMHFKGTHMSRFIEALIPWGSKPISNAELRSLLVDTCGKLEADQAEVTIAFKYFIEKKAPVSGRSSFMDYDCTFRARRDKDRHTFLLGVEVPVTSCCPCSKEISDFGAHNQRTLIRATVRFHGGFLWIEDLVDRLESQGSCQLYPLLKREDEKFVTEQAYENAKFVEDILRDTVITLRNEPLVSWFDVECESMESIHNHSAFAKHTEAK
ncbi:MAG: GTP cyclohydrolase I FolE2 [Firmicutes bacterium]|nr:GTP cyclohydrolase I FolE2 [Bacillota bacterium]